MPTVSILRKEVFFFMEMNHLQHYLQHHFSREEIAEEFGVHRPTVDRELSTLIGKKKNLKKGGDRDEKEKKLRSESKNSSR